MATTSPAAAAASPEAAPEDSQIEAEEFVRARPAACDGDRTLLLTDVDTAGQRH